VENESHLVADRVGMYYIPAWNILGSGFYSMAGITTQKTGGHAS
jgi:hypothetical protein